MDKKLLVQAIVKVIFGIILIALLLFIPAGTLDYSNAWLFMALLFIPMVIAGFVLMAKNPDLLRKRLNSDEKEKEQKIIIAASAVMFLVGFIVAGLDFRFKWLVLPTPVVIVASVIFLLSYLLYAEVMRENVYLSRTVEVQENQKVIDTGLYGIVRHPMYMATTTLFMSMPLVLGSLISFIVFLPLPIILAARIKNEEKVLEAGLDGYTEYKKKVKFRMIPFIW